MNDRIEAGPLSGRSIALLETREAERLAQMLREQGADVVSVPAVAIVDAADPAPVLAWIKRFIADPADYLVLLTGEGLSRLHELARRTGIGADFVAVARPHDDNHPRPEAGSGVARARIGAAAARRRSHNRRPDRRAVRPRIARPASRRAALPGRAEPPHRFPRSRRRLARSGHPVRLRRRRVRRRARRADREDRRPAGSTRSPLPAPRRPGVCSTSPGNAAKRIG